MLSEKQKKARREANRCSCGSRAFATDYDMTGFAILTCVSCHYAWTEAELRRYHAQRVREGGKAL